MRRLISAAGQIAALAYEDQGEVDEVVDKAEQMLFEVSQRRISRELVPIKEIIAGYYDRVEFLLDHHGQAFGLPTGFVDLDAMLGGLQKSDLIIIAARPAMGKTSLAITMAVNAALKSNAVVAIFTLEMSAEQLVQRMVQGRAGIRLTSCASATSPTWNGITLPRRAPTSLRCRSLSTTRPRPRPWRFAPRRAAWLPSMAWT